MYGYSSTYCSFGIEVDLSFEFSILVLTASNSTRLEARPMC